MKTKRFITVYTQGIFNITEIIVDLETGINYIGRGNLFSYAITPLLDHEGKQIITNDWEVLNSSLKK